MPSPAIRCKARFSWEDASVWLTGLAAVAIVFSIAASQILLGAALLALLLRRDSLQFPHRVGLAILAFAGWTLLSLAFSKDPMGGLPQVKKLYAFLIPVVVYNAFGNHRHIWRTAQAVALAGALAAAYGLGQFLHDFLALRQRGLSFYEHYVLHQISGFHSHWLTYGGQLLFVLLLAASATLFVRRAESRLFWGFCGVLTSLALVAAFTRGLWIAALAGVAYLVVRCRPRWLWLLPAALVALYWFSPSWLQERGRSIANLQTDSSNQARIVMLRTGWEMIAAHPWLGLGPEQVGVEFLHYKPRELPLPRAWYGHLHNSYTQLAAERGIPCLLFWLWFLWEILREHHQLTKHAASRAKALGHAGMAMTLGLMAAGLFEFNVGDSEVLMLYLFLIFLGYGWLRGETESVAPRATASGAMREPNSAGEPMHLETERTP